MIRSYFQNHSKDFSYYEINYMIIVVNGILLLKQKNKLNINSSYGV